MRRHPAPVSSLSLEHWYRQWALHEAYIRCKFCDATQDYVYATRPFVHEFNCPARSLFSQYPLRERRQLLEHK